jgi:hypothetical protein
MLKRVGAPLTVQSEGVAGAPSKTGVGLVLSVGTIVMIASLANFLAFNSYPLLRLEVALVALAMAALSVLVGGVYLASSKLLRSLLEGFLVFLAVDLNSDAALVGVSLAIAAFLLRLLKGVSVLPVLAIIAAVVLLSVPLGLAPARSPIETTKGPTVATSTAPPIVHLILDEHVGIEGVADDALQEELRRFYATRGFTLFDRAYSRHFHTINAIPDMLNFGRPGESSASMEHVRVGKTRYFSGLASEGYGLHITEPEFADYCSDIRFATCTRYYSPSLGFVDATPLDTLDRALLIGVKLASLSASAVGLGNVYDAFVAAPYGLPGAQFVNRSKSSSIGAMAAFDTFADSLRQVAPGNAYFAHLLFPHYPYVTDEECRILPQERWDHRRSRSPQSRREEAYHRQLRCTMRKVDKLLTALASAPAGRSAVVVIHGDHGSRISSRDPLAADIGKFTDRDLVAGFSTLFAVRLPSRDGRVVAAPAPAPALLQSLAAGGFRSIGLIARNKHEVVLDDAAWQPRRKHPLPSSWQPSAP